MNLLPFDLSNLKDHWKLIGIGLLALAVMVQTLRLSASEARLAASVAGRKADRTSYEAAQAQATANAIAAKAEKEKDYAKKADDADARYADLRAHYDSVLRAKAAQSATGRANLPKPAEAAKIVDGPSAIAILPSGSILIPEADAFICADTTARLQAARDWALAIE